MLGLWTALLCVIFFPSFLNLQGLSQAESCNQTLKKKNGTFTSPWFPYDYGYTTLCNWTIEVDSNHIITLSFIEFNLKSSSTCGYEYVKIYDGSDANDPLLGQYCGDTLPNTTRSTGNTMYIVFRRDWTTPYKGFSAAYSQDCVTGKYGVGCTKTCSANCKDGECNSSNGTCTKGCNNGYYDTECNKNCSKNCKGDTCEQDGGKCEEGCKNGYLGDKCDDKCLTGTYGPSCNMTCSITCYINVTHVHSCHHQTGVCLQGCIKGYTGDQCEIKLPDDSTSNVAVGVGVGVTATLLVCVIIVLVAVYLYKKRGYLKRRAPQPAKPTTAQQQKPSGRGGNKRQEQDDEHYYESYGGAKAMTASASQVGAAETMEEKTEYENADVGLYEDIIEMESLDGRGLYENNTYGVVTATAEEISKRSKVKATNQPPLR